MRILVTGGAGFIGSHLCGALLNKGHKVICLDNLYTGSKDNIKHLMDNPDFEFLEKDVTEPIDIEVDQIYNLACPASPVHYQKNPIKTFETSVLGIRNMLELCRKNGCVLLQASTSEIYGDPLEHPQTEKYWGNVNSIGIRACYDEGKRAAETLIMDYKRMYGLNVKIARIFNTYGPKMEIGDGRVVSNFVVQALQGKDITVFGDGNQTRSFCYISDMVEGLIKMMESNETGPTNLGNPNEFTITDFANKVVNLIGSGSKIIFEKLPEDDPKKRNPNITLAKEKLGWGPVVQLDEGLSKTINYFKGLIN
ncbi:MAG: UDP-glucuronic acid decarboxylase family protein [Candidatus Woesearchaeota archaeon]